MFELRAMFLKIWQEANDIETERIKGIQHLYEEIVKINQTIYGQDILQKLIECRVQFKSNELYSFRGICREKELEAFVALCYQQK